MEPLTADDPRVIGSFRLQARLGAGGMGRVYLGFSPGGRAVAVKVIHPRLARDEEFAARFRREVAAAQAVNTVYAVPAVAAGPDDDPPWLATAFVPAPSLQDVVATAGPLPEDAVWKLTAGLAEALRAIHAGGLVHRDLKPGNVLLAVDGPRVIDFGIARVIDGTRLTSTGSVLGTPSFMSPEQAQGKQVNPPSDVFSLGGVAYFAATGRAPFGGGLPATLMYRIVFADPDLGGVPPRLRPLIAACLNKDPAARPTPAQLTAALPAAGPGTSAAPSATGFWSPPVARFIRDYQARLDPQGALAWQASSGRQADAVESPRSMEPMTVKVRSRGRHAAAPAPVEGMGRRRALAALAGAVTAGAGVAVWKLAVPAIARADTGKPAAAQSTPPGTGIWRFKANNGVESVATVGNTVYAGTGGNTVFAIDAATGRQLWRSDVTNENNFPLVATGGSVIVNGDEDIFALAADTGGPLWHANSDAGNALAAAGDVVYAGIAPKNPGTGGVTALSARTGELLWTYPFAAAVDTTGWLVVTGGVVYASTGDGEIFALSAADGTEHSRITGFSGSDAPATLSVAGDVVYAGGGKDNGVVYAVSAASGQTLWQRDLGASSSAAELAIGNGILFAGLEAQSAAPALYALNAATGRTLWSASVPGGLEVPLVVAGDTVYIPSQDGVLEALQASTGKKLWSYQAPHDINGSVTLGSRVYFGAGDFVYAVSR